MMQEMAERGRRRMDGRRRDEQEIVSNVKIGDGGVMYRNLWGIW